MVAWLSSCRQSGQQTNSEAISRVNTKNKFKNLKKKYKIKSAILYILPVSHTNSEFKTKILQSAHLSVMFLMRL